MKYIFKSFSSVIYITDLYIINNKEIEIWPLKPAF